LCINPVFQESNVCPRSGEITASNQDDFLHLFNPEPKPSGKEKPAVNMLRYPPAKITLRKSVFTLSRYRQV
jgi:hypothetical protein